MIVSDATDVTLAAGMVLLLWVGLLRADCNLGWFGSSCQYKCRCTDDSCDESGLCTGSARCLSGWFGAACQYADLAYNMSSLTEITDGDDQTCISNPDLARIDVQLNAIFTWLRVFVSHPNSQHKLKFRLRRGSSVDWCNQARTATVSDRMLDVYCPSNRTVLGVIILGPGVQHLCSVYISGGRNIALKQATNQTSTHLGFDENDQVVLFGPDKAVDGGTDQHFSAGLTCTHTIHDQEVSHFWSVTLGHPARVSRYVLYNLADAAYLLMGFKLDSFNREGVRIFSFTDTNPVAQSVYTIHKETVGVVSVKITGGSILALCEVEVYGDVMCEPGNYGRECEKKCHCFNSTDCFVSSGGCPSGCAAGFHRENCSIPCGRGQYGVQCLYNCSQFCVEDSSDPTSCDHVTGRCVRGCESGYSQPNCQPACESGNDGASCGSSCSPTCASSDDATATCSLEDGACLYGCDPGYSGAKCEDVCMSGRYGEECSMSCSQNCQPSPDKQGSSCDPVNGACLYGCTNALNSSYCKSASVKRLETSFQDQLLAEVWPQSKSLIIGFSMVALAGVLLVLGYVIFIKRPCYSDEGEETE